MKDREKNPEQYIIVPTALLQADISPNSKLLYGLILSLSRSNKFTFDELCVCFANNNYLARNLGSVSVTTIQNSIKELEAQGFIHRDIDQDRPNQKRRQLVPTSEGWDMKFVSGEQIWKENENKLKELEKQQMIEQEYSSRGGLSDNLKDEIPF